MKITEKAANIMKNDVVGKDVLEVACGSADLSVSVSSLARTVKCIDLVGFRLNPELNNCSNVQFNVMDATGMTFDDCSFDTVVIYNAAYHIKDEFAAIVSECMRVTRQSGAIYVISSVSIDKAVFDDGIIPYLNVIGAQFAVERDKTFISVRIAV